MESFCLGNRKIGPGYEPLVIPEIGINHEGDFKKAIRMIEAAKDAGAEIVKFQYHIADKEMVPNNIIPKNADESIWDIIERCQLTDEEERKLKQYCEELGLMYLSTPFSREAADRLEDMGVIGFKIGSGECNNIPLIEHISKKKKPIILSTGMNGIDSVKNSVEIIKKHQCPYMLMQCTSMYPTPYEKVRLGAMKELAEVCGAAVGLSDHSVGLYTVFGAVALGASAIEKHFTFDKNWSGPDISISIDPAELADLIKGAKAIFKARDGIKTVLSEEKPVIDFAYATLCAIRDIKKGEVLTEKNVWVKRPGTGEIPAKDLNLFLGKKAKEDISKNHQLTRSLICE